MFNKTKNMNKNKKNNNKSSYLEIPKKFKKQIPSAPFSEI